MNDQSSSSQPLSGNASSQEMMSALFAQLIMQQTNMAMILLGKVNHPESGQSYKDVESARVFIDQLEMLEAKTKGNLTKEETALLKQSLMNLRLAFVDAVQTPQPASSGTATKETSTPSGAQAAAAPSEAAGEASTAEQDEHRKKFSKKY
jgi:hypothetical protein